MKIHKRTIMLIGIFIACVLAAIIQRQFQRPGAAPADIQESGRTIIRAELAKLDRSDFGRTNRGRLLIAEVESLLKRNRIVFSAQLGGRRGLSWSDWLGRKTVFIRVLQVNEEKQLHQLPFQITESLFHEAIHSLKRRFGRTSIEEECDAFAAGLCAEAASKGDEPPSDPLRIDGIPVAEFVTASYPNASRKPDYQPIGESLDWLNKRTGLTGQMKTTVP